MARLGMAAAWLACFLTGAAHAATFTLAPTDDGYVRTFGGDTVDTTDTRVSVSQSGSNITNGILEFDLTSVPDAATIVAARLDVTLVAFTSNTSTNPANIHIFGYNGDGSVTIGDYGAAAGPAVVSTTTPQGGSAGTELSFSFATLSPVTAALPGNALTLRVETDSFATFRFASLENASLDAARLVITTAAVPVPAGLPFMVAGLAALGWVARRRSG